MRNILRNKAEGSAQSYMRYDEKKKQWNFTYNPIICTKISSSGFCLLRNKMLDSKRGNVFYDLKVMIVRKDDTFFHGEPLVSIKKGRRLLEKPVSMDINIEIPNLRAEARESRDFEQDLEDIRNGIIVVHESDQIQAAKKRKREKRQEQYILQKTEFATGIFFYTT